jgi:Cysteine-rich secretory protein family
MRGLLWLGCGGCVAAVEVAPLDPLDVGTSTHTPPLPDVIVPVIPPDDVGQGCVDVINAYRDSLGLAHLERWVDAEACASEQAQLDYEADEAHSSFGACDERAQNTCPGWPLPIDGSLPDCLQLMWREGPGEDFEAHGHFLNMSNPSYTQVACGTYETPDGSWWGVQDFR